VPSLTLTAGLTYDAPSSLWTLTLATSGPSEVSDSILVVVRAKTVDPAPDEAPQTGYRAWTWSSPQYRRVANHVDLSGLGVIDPSEADVYDPDEATNGTYAFGYHAYRTNSISQTYTKWDAANNAYQAARGGVKALLGVDSSSTSGTFGPLTLGVIGAVPYRDSSVAYSVYPGDQLHFEASGGVREYVYSLVSDGTTNSSLVTSTGVFVAGGVDVVETVTVRVTDSVSDTADIVVTVKAPTAPTASEVLNV